MNQSIRKQGNEIHEFDEGLLSRKPVDNKQIIGRISA